MAAKLTVRFSVMLSVAVSVGLTCATAAVTAATPTAEQALRLAPVQKDVDYIDPPRKMPSKCTIKSEKRKKQTGWIIRDESGKILREFVDTNGDNIVDHWSYFKDGVEVYRDIDTKFAGKANEFRWLNTGGVRWGIARETDGQIDLVEDDLRRGDERRSGDGDSRQ